jgi:hypothetical protein
MKHEQAKQRANGTSPCSRWAGAGVHRFQQASHWERGSQADEQSDVSRPVSDVSKITTHLFCSQKCAAEACQIEKANR